jgi:hypothetical protein
MLKKIQMQKVNLNIDQVKCGIEFIQKCEIELKHNEMVKGNTVIPAK